MPVYAKKVATGAPMFQNRVISVITPDSHTDIPVPNDEVICNGCNGNIHETEAKEGYLIYLSKRDLAENQSYDVYCADCLKSYFPKAVMV